MVCRQGLGEPEAFGPPRYSLPMKTCQGANRNQGKGQRLLEIISKNGFWSNPPTFGGAYVGGDEFRTAGIRRYVEDSKPGPNTCPTVSGRLGPKDFFEIASNNIFDSGSKLLRSNCQLSHMALIHAAPSGGYFSVSFPAK